MRGQAKRLAPTTHNTTTTVVAIMFQEIGSCRKAAAKVKPKNGCSFVPAEVAHFKSDPVGRMQALAKEPRRENVEVISTDLVAMRETTQPADVLWLHLFYHDLHTALMQARGATAADFNRAVYERLKPGGSYVIVDHAAASGTGTSDAQSLHRIEPASVREEVEAAGFVLDAESTMLANKDDPHSTKVFDPSIKGETDRFAYRFMKV